MRNNLIRGPGAVLATTLLLAVVPTTRAAPGVDQGRPLFSLDGHSLDVSTVAFSPDGKRIASASNREVKLWDANTGKEILNYAVRGTNVYGLAFSPDGQTLAVGISRDVKLLETATGKELLWIRNAPHFLFRMSFSPDGSRLAAASGMMGDKPGDVHIWDPKTGKEVMTLGGHAEAVLHVAYSADGKYLLTGTGGTSGTRPGQVRLWEVATGRMVRTLGGHATNVYGVAFSPDGRLIVSAGGPRAGPGKGEVKVWEMTTGREVMQFAGHAATAYAIVFSPNGRFLASGGSDGKLGFWDVHSGREVRSLAAHNGPVYSVAFSPDGKRIVTSGRDRAVKVWDVGLPAGRRPGQAALKPKEVEAFWDDLAGDGPRAFQAVWALRDAPVQAVPFLKKRLRPAAPLKPDQELRLRQLIRALDDRRFAIREKAGQEVIALGPAAVPALKQALNDKPSAEARRRLEPLLEALSGTVLSAEQMQGLRAVDVLEYIGTPEARQILESLATGLATARLTEEAKASLERLAERTRQER